MSSQIFGNLIGAAVLKGSNAVNFFLIMASVGFLASFSFGFLRKPKQSIVVNIKLENSTEDVVLSNQELSQRLSTTAGEAP